MKSLTRTSLSLALALATMTGRPLESLLSQPLENLFTASAGAI